MTSKQLYALASELPNVTMKDHFGGDAFSANKRMFITIWHDHNKANLRLTKEEQRRFLEIDGDAFVMIDNAWGRQGWTSVNLDYVDKADMKAALDSAYEYSKHAGPKLGAGKAKKKPMATKTGARRK